MNSYNCLQNYNLTVKFTLVHGKVEVKPAKIYSKPLEDVGEGDEEWSGEEEDAVEEVIIPGTDWESVNYVYKKFSCEVSIFKSCVEALAFKAIKY